MKYFQSNQEITNMKLVRFEEENGPDWPFLFESKEGWLKIVEKIFKERDEYQYFRYDTEESIIKPEKPDELPKGSPAYAIKEYSKRMKVYKRKYQWYLQQVDDIKTIKKARTGDVLAMEKFLYNMAEGEYQGFYFDDIESYG